MGSIEQPAPIDLSGAVDTLELGPATWSRTVALGPGDSVYGSGESFLGLNLRGRRRTLINRETNGAGGVDLAYLNVPFFWSDAGWGILVETGAPVVADVGATVDGEMRLAVYGDEPRVRWFAGSPGEILEAYTAATGRVGDWPEWAFGTWMSRATYLDEAELHQVVDELSAADCPVDVIHVDAWLAGNVFREFTCSWQADRDRFPVGWTQRLRERGVRTSVWLNPFVLAGTAQGEGLIDRGLVLRSPDGGPAVTADRPDRHLVDFTNPAAVDWWAERVRTLLREESPDALKLDFAEEVPLDAVCHDGRSGRQVRNSYARMYQQATASAIPGDQRPMPLFCRSGTAGSQTTPCHWVGDTPATWEGLAGALWACLSLSASGFALVTHDGGGFHCGETSEIPAILLDGGDAEFTAEVDPELYGRWGQWAAFSPVTRFHGLGRREPTAYPEPWRGAVIKALKWRARLRPQLVAAHTQARRTGLPLMRPMALDPTIRAPAEADAQYFLGADLLVAPVLQPGGEVSVWFPDAGWQPLLGAAPPIERGWLTMTLKPHQFAVYQRVEGSGV